MTCARKQSTILLLPLLRRKAGEFGSHGDRRLLLLRVRPKVSASHSSTFPCTWLFVTHPAEDRLRIEEPPINL